MEVEEAATEAGVDAALEAAEAVLEAAPEADSYAAQRDRPADVAIARSVEAVQAVAMQGRAAEAMMASFAGSHWHAMSVNDEQEVSPAAVTKHVRAQGGTADN